MSNDPKKQKEEKAENPMNRPWISMRRGMIIIAFTSVAMAVLTAWQVIPSKGWMEGILWRFDLGNFLW